MKSLHKLRVAAVAVAFVAGGCGYTGPSDRIREPEEDELEPRYSQDRFTDVDHDRDGSRVQQGALVVPTVYRDVSRPLSEMAAAAGQGPVRTKPEAEVPGRIPHTETFWANKFDTAEQTASFKGIAAQAPTPLISFNGLGKGFSGPGGTFSVQASPPDTIGDVGLTHYVQTVNIGMVVFRKDGTPILGPTATKTVWQGMNHACANTNDGDATVRYDRYADRWIVSQFSINQAQGPFYQCIAVSQTGDPTGQWNRYAYQFDKLNDYPKMSVWPDAYYFSYNMFKPGTGGNFDFAGAKICAVDRAKMLTGAAATQQCFDTNTDWGGLLTADVDGPTLPPAGAPNPVLGLGNTNLGIFKFHVDWNNPAQSTFTGPTTIGVQAFTPLCGTDTQTCIPQKGTTQQLDAISDRLMNRLVYRNFGDHEALVVNHSVAGNGGGGAIRWYELRDLSAATPTIYQQGTFAPDTNFRWMGSIAMDKKGNIAMGYAVSSSTIYPSISFTGRMAGDPLNAMTLGEATLIAGTGYQNGIPFLGGGNRFGDYSSLNIDPADDCTFWYTQEYIATSGSNSWNTRIGSFKLAGCDAGGDAVPPTVGITSPANGASVSGSTSIQANASDNVGVTKVEFYVDGALLSTVNTAPYATNWATTSTTNGSHNLTARAYDAAGNVGNAAAIQVTVNNTTTDTQPPTVSIANPANGATVSGAVDLQANASDNVGVVRVEFYADTTLIGTDTSAPYALSWNSGSVTNGAHALSAKAFDAAGNVGSSAQVNVTVNNATDGQLQNGVPVTNLGGAAGSSTQFTLDVPAGATNLKFQLSGGTGDADLYVRFGSAPTTSTYDCRPYQSGNNETCNFASPSPGRYYVMVQGYAAFSGAQLVGSFSSNDSTPLQNGTPVTGLSDAQGGTKYFKLEVPSTATNVKFQLAGGTGDADLYVRFGALPTTGAGNYDCRPYLNGNNETCSLAARAGTWYVMIRGFTNYSGASLTGTSSP